MEKSLLYLDDVKVGDTFKSREYLLSKDEMIEFAAKYDPQDFHLDEEKAKDTFFRGLSGSGWYAASVTMRLIVESVPFAHGIIGAGVELEWPNPTRPEDKISTTSVVKDINYSNSKPNQGLIILESTSSNQDDEPVIVITAKLLNFKRK